MALDRHGVHAGFEDEWMTDFYLIQDTRTTYFFGGGRADKLFSHWVADAEQAKRFFRPETAVDCLQQMHLRAMNNPPTPENAEILKAIPLFDPSAYQIHKYESGSLAGTDNVFPLLERLTTTQ